ncbi:MAG: TetR/AcrR family transcriptional regulator [Deltaproteobacteria bacterium]|nr:TetR/AcrR family transcriptional regulator [Deltaproteobacteria bacterium]
MPAKKMARSAARSLQDRARQARTDLYREHILEVAEQMFAERGFENAKLQDIGREAGVSMGTIYAVFPSKEDLFRAILDLRGKAILAVARAAVDGAGDPRAALDRLIEAYLDFFIAHPQFLRMHLRHGSSWVLGPSQGSSGQVELWADIHALQSELMRRGVADGVFVDEDPAFLAKIFSALDQVLLADWVTGGMRTSRDQLVGRLRGLVARVIVRTN